ncbi:MAG TPA: ABC transporter permease [Burkholderiales bacterium]|jgi:NitT/TauT family transport system permease protein|nr:ABC transporter permease [Burkholderiales bacterium]
MTPATVQEPAFGRGGFAAIAGLLVVWELLGQMHLTIFVPPASAVAQAWWGLVTDGTLFRAAGSSLLSLLKGFVPAAVLGVALGLAMGRFRSVRYLLDGWINAFMSAPLSALVPVLIALFGIRDTVVAATVFLFSFFVIVVNTTTGVRGTERSLVEMARAFGASEAALFGRIYLPSALPAVMLGLRLGVVQAVKGMVVGEMLISLVGMGERLIYYGNTFLIPELYAVIVSVLLVAILSSTMVQACEHLFVRWK